MKNEFIPYEEALALKELGFDEECFGCYTKDKELSLDYSDNKGEGHYFQYCSAPLYQQAFRWFREKCELDFYIKKESHPVYFSYVWNGIIWEQVGEGTYEEAELACLRKLIEFNVGIIRISLLKPKEDE